MPFDIAKQESRDNRSSCEPQEHPVAGLITIGPTTWRSKEIAETLRKLRGCVDFDGIYYFIAYYFIAYVQRQYHHHFPTAKLLSEAIDHILAKIVADIIILTTTLARMHHLGAFMAGTEVLAT